ncbi:Protein of unknown function [Pyronema omphalodes CBS 100304]|uniref:Uncharacterized protein n=1 Tax=Pyronema omphalodes (strain CBS 100304) TaxID=1076935 RepID=U4L8L4_PYROM|nr:Protein of unknown function [Pyronema omphalodes CBS 100304]
MGWTLEPATFFGSKFAGTLLRFVVMMRMKWQVGGVGGARVMVDGG